MLPDSLSRSAETTKIQDFMTQGLEIRVERMSAIKTQVK